MSFEDEFALLSGNPPFPWQRALFERLIAHDIPRACDLPTGLGKTSVIALWLLALARNPKLPRRLVYVVNRRTVVDQATSEAERLRQRLADPSATALREALASMSAISAESPLAISTLRGEFADNGAWRRDPARPAIIVGTVDMIGSRLLFSGYGCGFRSRPLHAGFLGQDVLLVHDEAHLEPAFQSLLTAIAEEQVRSNEPRPIKVLALSATSRDEPDFMLGAEDLGHSVVKKRLHAAKTLQVHAVKDRTGLPDQIVAKARELSGKIIVFLSSVDHAEKCASMLRKVMKSSVVTLTGTMRGAERDTLVKHPVFSRFLPRPAEGIALQDGTVFLVATSAGEVGIDLSADHLLTDLPPFEALAQRLGRVNRYGECEAEVHVFCEPLDAPRAVNSAGGDEGDEDDARGRRNDDYSDARYFTLALLKSLPPVGEDLRDASPWALRSLPREARLQASTPRPQIPHVDEMLFDRWSYTTMKDPLPGRPAVADWLHGIAEWEPPRTTVAWRCEVAWLSEEHLGLETLDDFLWDYPLRSRETLSDITTRVLKHLEKVVQRDDEGVLSAWLIRHGEPAALVRLRDLVEAYDAKRNPSLDGATVVLAPAAGALREGLLDGNAEFDQAVRYDLGPMEAERLVSESKEEPNIPSGMRLVRAVKRRLEEEDDTPVWWRLYTTAERADDEGSQSSRKELLLDAHLQRTEAWATLIAQRLALPAPEQRALAQAARAHDLGKQRRVWQRSIKRFTTPPLAKGPMQPHQLGHYRHELGSLHDAAFDGLSVAEKDLALHVIAAHHGRARPHFPLVEAYDPEVRDEIVSGLVREVPLRFDRLQRVYGRWGLAYLESILRAADVLGSEDEVAE